MTLPLQWCVDLCCPGACVCDFRQRYGADPDCSRGPEAVRMRISQIPIARLPDSMDAPCWYWFWWSCSGQRPSVAKRGGFVFIGCSRSWPLRMSLVWYTLSYIPYGQKMAWRLLTKCLGLSPATGLQYSGAIGVMQFDFEISGCSWCCTFWRCCTVFSFSKTRACWSGSISVSPAKALHKAITKIFLQVFHWETQTSLH